MAADGEYRVSTQSTVTLNVTTSLSSFPLERRFNKGITVANLKDRLELLTGACPATMRLQLFGKKDSSTPICDLNDDAQLLGFYPVEDGMTLNVLDEVTAAKAARAAAELDSISSEQKFELTDEEYTKRNDTVKAYLVRNKLGKYAETTDAVVDDSSERDSTDDHNEKNDVSRLTVGSRCEVTVQGQLPKRGAIKFVGKTHLKPGLWVGVAYDEPVGKNDGSIEGKRYFECTPKYGAFVRPQFVVAGDFPEEELDLDEM